MKYVSTRTDGHSITFKELLFATLAPDKGLYLPQYFPDFSGKLSDLANLSYQDLTFELLAPFLAGEIDDYDLQEIIRRSYVKFRHPEVVFLRQFADFSLLELFHGPTWAFKDLALQLLAGLFEYFLDKTDKKLTILGSTSGDTGSAALAAFSAKKNIKVIILHPHQRISELQKRQMTTLPYDNLANIAIHGSFDDSQAIVKKIFENQEFTKKYNLAAVNSINLVRILAQIPYYFYAYFQEPKKIHYFSVPSGNFGNVLAGLFAKKMGLPIKKLVVATNQNNVLETALQSGIYRPKPAIASISPSMDIQVASNFERYLYLLSSGDHKLVKKCYLELNSKKSFTILDSYRNKIAEDFLAGHASEEETKATIHDFYQAHGYILDPHSAVGVTVGKRLLKQRFISLATAHPAKFFETIQNTLHHDYSLPTELAELFDKPTRLTVLENDSELVTDFIANFAK